jgi:S1-C subfamily serine protease
MKQTAHTTKSTPKTARLGPVAIILWLIVTATAVGNSPAQLKVDPELLEAEAIRIRTIDKASKPTLAIFDPHGTRQKAGGGSGVIISPDGFALTNFHVSQSIGPWLKCGMNNGQLYDAVIVGVDPTGDIALIKLFGRERFPFAPLGDSDQTTVGEEVFVIGNPFLLATDLRPTVTTGIISGLHRYQFPSGSILEYTDCLQTDASINPGNSGGPLFNARGELIGINGRGSFEKRGRINVGVGYAISINQIKRFLGPLKSGRVVDHATLGAKVAFDQASRVIVDEILEDSDAYRRGLRYGDEILSLAGRRIESPNELKNFLGTLPRRWRVELVYRREGVKHSIPVRLDRLHPEGKLEKIAAKKPIEKPTRPPKPDSPTPKPKAMPPKVKSHYQFQAGQVNRYFNRTSLALIQQRWQKNIDDPQSLRGSWTLKGQTDGEQPITFKIGPNWAKAELPGGSLDWKATTERDTNLSPPGSGGLLLALHLWNQFENGKLTPDELTYWGQLPADAWDRTDRLQHEPATPVELVIGERDGAEIDFFFDSTSGRLLGIDLFPFDDTDPCEIRFYDYKKIGNETLPTRWVIYHGDNRYGILNLEQFKINGSNKNQ